MDLNPVSDAETIDELESFAAGVWADAVEEDVDAVNRDSSLATTTRKALIDARRGQGLFRGRRLRRSLGPRLCGDELQGPRDPSSLSHQAVEAFPVDNLTKSRPTIRGTCCINIIADGGSRTSCVRSARSKGCPLLRGAVR